MQLGARVAAALTSSPDKLVLLHIDGWLAAAILPSDVNGSKNFTCGGSTWTVPLGAWEDEVSGLQRDMAAYQARAAVATPAQLATVIVGMQGARNAVVAAHSFNKQLLTTVLCTAVLANNDRTC